MKLLKILKKFFEYKWEEICDALSGTLIPILTIIGTILGLGFLIICLTYLEQFGWFIIFMAYLGILMIVGCCFVLLVLIGMWFRQNWKKAKEWVNENDYNT